VPARGMHVSLCAMNPMTNSVYIFEVVLPMVMFVWQFVLPCRWLQYSLLGNGGIQKINSQPPILFFEIKARLSSACIITHAWLHLADHVFN
jgi:hypothetical protein